MKRFFKLLLITLAFFVLIILVRTFMVADTQTSVSANEPIALPDSVSERLSGAIRIPTISNEGNANFDSAAFSSFHNYVSQNFPLADSLLEKTFINEFSVIYHWKGSDTGLKPIILMGHLDVVPVPEENRAKWTYPPFSGEIADGEIWGRGAIDNKLSVIGNLEAVEYLLAAGFTPKRSILLCFGHDEEIGGELGAKIIVEELKRRGIEAEFVMDEGGAITRGMVPGVSKKVATVGIAEKGFFSAILKVEMEGGHSSQPSPETTIDVLARAVVKLKENPFPAEITDPVAQFMEALTPEVSFGQKMVFANRWLFDPLIKMIFSQSNSGNAMMRTTTAPTIFHSGVKDNVLPYEASATVNFRLLPGTKADDVVEHIRKTVDDERVQIKKGPFISEPPEVSSSESTGYQQITQTIREIYPKTLTAPYLVVGGTDSRYYTPLTSDIYRFTPFQVTPKTMSVFHGVNERISIEDYENGVRFYINLIKNATN